MEYSSIFLHSFQLRKIPRTQEKNDYCYGNNLLHNMTIVSVESTLLFQKC